MEGLNPKQQKFVNAFRSGKYRYMMAAGSTGSGKSIVDLSLLHYLCLNINDVRFAVLRKSEKNLKQTTIPSYNKVKRLTKSFNESIVIDMKAKYRRTGSEILFIWADHTKDIDLDNIKGLELTGALIEEANQIDKGYFDLLKTRIGRWNNQKIFPFILLNMNPSLGWCKDLFYDPWTENKLPERYYFEEFSVDDNPTLDIEYVKGLEDLPTVEYNRYVKNDWNYSDNPKQLIKFEWYKQCWIDQLIKNKAGRNCQGIDPSGEGSNRTIFAHMHDNQIHRYEEYPKQDPVRTGEIALENAYELNIAPSDTVIDGVGVGDGTVAQMRKGIIVKENEPIFKQEPTRFLGGNPSVTRTGFLSYFNVRTEAFWLLKEALKNEKILVKHHPSLQKELLAIEYEVNNERVIRVMSKKLMRKNLKMSPDYADAVSMVNWIYFTSKSNLSANLFERQLNEVKKPLRRKLSIVAD